MYHGHAIVPSVANPNRWLFSFLVFAGSIALMTLTLAAQSGTDSTGTGGKHSIQGRIFYPSGPRIDTRTQVRLEGTNTGGLSVMCDSNGSFRFSSLAPGSYTVVVDGGDNYENARDTVYIDSDIRPPPGVIIPTYGRSYTVNIELRYKRSVVAAGKVGVVDASLAAAPDNARKLFDQAVAAARASKHEEAVQALLSAIAAYPEFALAYNELGVQYLFLQRPNQAIPALRTAVRLSPDAYAPRLNLGKALYQNNQNTEAETEIRTALVKNDADWQGHLWLGLTQIKLKRFDDAEKEMLRSLALGAKDLSLPHYYLGGIYWRAGDHKRAADELEMYL
ncbi:MAG: tetratricopeptide repeat protein, partial [Pyrinomonadaceae bacterium]